MGFTQLWPADGQQVTALDEASWKSSELGWIVLKAGRPSLDGRLACSAPAVIVPSAQPCLLAPELTARNSA
jgi:hypothetical protein